MLRSGRAVRLVGDEELTVAAVETTTQEFLDRLGAAYDFEPPREHGYDVVRSIEAMLAGDVKVFIGLGGNFSIATPDTPRVVRILEESYAREPELSPFTQIKEGLSLALSYTVF